MTWWTRSAASVPDALAVARADVRAAEQHAHRLEIAFELTLQAKTFHELDAKYWRECAERFIDQIGLRTGIISAPTMTEQPAPPVDKVSTVFDALGISEISSTHRRPAGSPAAVVGVDPVAAGAAVKDLLNRFNS